MGVDAPLSRRLLALSGIDDLGPTPDQGILFHHMSLDQLMHRGRHLESRACVDLDSIEGLRADFTAAPFLSAELPIEAFMTRRPSVGSQIAESGRIGFLRVSALDSTGLERALAGHSGTANLGTAISPGLVLAHLAPSIVASMPKPVLAYGLIRTRTEMQAAFDAGAAIVVLSPYMDTSTTRLRQSQTLSR
jgi:glycerol uptake operon antiterminator